MKKTILSILCLTLWFVTPVLSDSFTDIQIGARPQGMGGAFVAVVDDANALYWNPAGIIQNSFVEITTMRGVPFGLKMDTLTNDYIAYAQPLSLRYGFGISWMRNAAKLEQGILKETSNMSENIYAISFALAGNSNYYFGTTFKRLVIDTKIESGAGFGFDLGILYKYNDYLSFGAMFRNLATDVKNERVPSAIRLGTALKLKKSLLAFDVNCKNGINSKKDTTYLYHFGIERRFTRYFTLRAGSNQDFNPSFGLGINHEIWNLDYAYFKYNDYLDYSHRISLSMHYGQ
ncbi:MAG: hypothetical protein QMD92_07015 [bacterium]|nr:hypothetical protein [bacterium]